MFFTGILAAYLSFLLIFSSFVDEKEWKCDCCKSVFCCYCFRSDKDCCQSCNCYDNCDCDCFKDLKNDSGAGIIIILGILLFVFVILYLFAMFLGKTASKIVGYIILFALNVLFAVLGIMQIKDNGADFFSVMVIIFGALAFIVDFVCFIYYGCKSCCSTEDEVTSYKYYMGLYK